MLVRRAVVVAGVAGALRCASDRSTPRVPGRVLLFFACVHVGEKGVQHDEFAILR